MSLLFFSYALPHSYRRTHVRTFRVHTRHNYHELLMKALRKFFIDRVKATSVTRYDSLLGISFAFSHRTAGEFAFVRDASREVSRRCS